MPTTRLLSCPPLWCHGFVQFNHYMVRAGEYAAALVNAAPTAVGYQAVVDQFVEPRCPVRPADVPSIADWAGRLRGFFAEPDIESRIDMVNLMLATAVETVFVSRHDGLAAHLHYVPVEADLVRRMRTRTAVGLAHLLCGGAGDRLGQCARDGCGVVFLDTSRNGRRRFCGVRCANVVRVSNHRSRRISR
jgi:hypothetical protein